MMNENERELMICGKSKVISKLGGSQQLIETSQNLFKRTITVALI